jgi:hypothetical protein
VRAVASIAAGLALCAAMAACGEKEENLDVVPETEPGLESVPPVPKASQVQFGAAAAEQYARTAATEKADPPYEVAEGAWTVTCKRPADGRVTCAVSAGLCGGSVIILPRKVPAGESAEGYVPKADASRVRCKS